MNTAGTWTEPEIKRFVLRDGLFQRRGLSAERSESLAEKCLERERDTGWRDMHACAECKHLQRGNRCAVLNLFTPPIDMLQRCHFFGWQVPRS
jgi:hypothetical protein